MIERYKPKGRDRALVPFPLNESLKTSIRAVLETASRIENASPKMHRDSFGSLAEKFRRTVIDALFDDSLSDVFIEITQDELIKGVAKSFKGSRPHGLVMIYEPDHQTPNKGISFTNARIVGSGHARVGRYSEEGNIDSK